MVVEDGLHGDAVADDIFASDGDLQAFFHQAELEVAASGGGQGAVEEELEWLLNEDAFPAVETMEPKQAVAAPRAKRMATEPGQRWCQHCGTTNTPQWRQGPEGRGTLCNACGVRYRSGRLLPEYRPLNSPTFSPEVHSNRHNRIVEMRHRRGSSATDVNAGLEATDGGGGEGAATEELDWLSNKDAMETIERKPSVVGPRTMGVSRRRRALASSPSPPRPSVGDAPGQRLCRPCPCGTTKMLQWTAAAAGEHKWLSRNDTFPAMEPEPSAVVPRTKGVLRRRRAQASSLSPSRSPTRAEPGEPRCRHCGTTETPQWREGPEGRGTLCNACGVRYGQGRLVPEYRPRSSPTSSPELHSNMHRRVIRMIQMPLPGKQRNSDAHTVNQ